MSEFFVTGGTLKQDAQSYVARSADSELLEILRAGEFCYVLTSRQMGKSSLMVRTAAQLRDEGVAVVVLDLTRIGQNLDVDQWYFSMLTHVGQQLRLEAELESFWDTHERDSPLHRFIGAIREVYLERKRKPLVIFVDEIDYVRSLQKFSADEFFAGIRECYNRRTQDPKLARLTFCLLGVATPSDLIRDERTTPFNIGRGIELRDFSDSEAKGLADGLSPHRESAHLLLQRILHWTAGQPYLTQKLCAEVVKAGAHTPQAVDFVCDDIYLSTQARERDDNLHFVRERLLHSAIDRAALLDTYAKVCRREQVADDRLNPVINELRLSGIVRLVDGFLKVRNRIYGRVFDLKWARDNLPDAEIRRQKEAFRRGVRRVAGISIAVLAIMGLLVSFALRASRREQAAAQTAKEAALREKSANRDRLAQAVTTEAALEASKAATAMLYANQKTTERLLEKLAPFVGERSDALLALAEELAQGLSSDATLDPQIRLGQAGLRAVCSKLYTKLGKNDKALAQALEARRIGTELLKANPDSLEIKGRLFDFHNAVGDALLGTRTTEAFRSKAPQQINDALVPCQAALELARSEFAAAPQDRIWRTRHLAALANIGDILALSGRKEEAERHFSDAEKFIIGLETKSGKDRGLELARASLKDRLGNLYLANQSNDKARAEFEESFKIRKEGFSEGLPGDIEVQSDLATSYNKLGNVFLAKGQWLEALQYHQQSLDIRDELCKQAPTPDRWRDLGYSINNVAKAHWELRHEAKAAELYRRRCDLTTRQLAEDPSKETFDDHSNALIHYADLLLNTADPSVRDWPKSLELARKAVELTNRKDARSLIILAQCLRLNNVPVEARTAAKEAQQLLPPPEQQTAEERDIAKNTAYELGKGSARLNPKPLAEAKGRKSR